jgi:hypothetical protein
MSTNKRFAIVVVVLLAAIPILYFQCRTTREERASAAVDEINKVFEQEAMRDRAFYDTDEHFVTVVFRTAWCNEGKLMLFVRSHEMRGPIRRGGFDKARCYGTDIEIAVGGM